MQPPEGCTPRAWTPSKPTAGLQCPHGADDVGSGCVPVSPWCTLCLSFPSCSCDAAEGEQLKMLGLTPPWGVLHPCTPLFSPQGRIDDGRREGRSPGVASGCRAALGAQGFGVFSCRAAADPRLESREQPWLVPMALGWGQQLCAARTRLSPPRGKGKKKYQVNKASLARVQQAGAPHGGRGHPTAPRYHETGQSWVEGQGPREVQGPGMQGGAGSGGAGVPRSVEGQD